MECVHEAFLAHRMAVEFATCIAVVFAACLAFEFATCIYCR